MDRETIVESNRVILPALPKRRGRSSIDRGRIMAEENVLKEVRGTGGLQFSKFFSG